MEDSPDPLEPYYFQYEPEIICGKQVTPITDDFTTSNPSMVDRFFTRYYYLKEEEPYLVLFHSNRICLICLAPEHSAMNAGIESINFDIGNLDRSKNVVKGKAKKGGMILSPETTLAVLTDSNGKTYKIPACLRGKLVEINSLIIEDPKRLENPAVGYGYIAIVQFSLGLCDLVKASLLTQEDYERTLRNKSASEEQQEIRSESSAKNESEVSIQE